MSFEAQRLPAVFGLQSSAPAPPIGLQDTHFDFVEFDNTQIDQRLDMLTVTLRPTVWLRTRASAMQHADISHSRTPPPDRALRLVLLCAVHNITTMQRVDDSGGDYHEDV